MIADYVADYPRFEETANEVAEIIYDRISPQWASMELAPKDKDIIVIDSVGGVHRCRWKENANTDKAWFRVSDSGWLPSACGWMPLPSSPIESKEEL